MTEVSIINWPEEADSAAGLVASGSPVLYLVRRFDDPPIITSFLEDWVRIPGDERDVHARIVLLESRAAGQLAAPRIDEAGVLHHRGSVTRLTPVQARLLELLIERVGETVSDDDLSEAASPARDGSSMALRTEMSRLRARLRVIGLSVDRIRGKGYVLRYR